MNIVVCYKIVPDDQDAVVNADRTLSFDRAALVIGDYDYNAVEAATQIAEEQEAKIYCLTAGGAATEDSKIRKGILSRGPEENVIVKDDSLASAGATQTASVLAAAIKKIGDVDLVLCGEGSPDLYSQQVGVQLGEMLGLPTVNAVSAIQIADGVAKVERTVGSVVDSLEIPLPAVLSVVADMNTPRIPSMKDILGAGKKPTTEYSLADLGCADQAASLETISTLAPEQRDRACEILPDDSDDSIQAFVARVREQL